MPQPLRFWGIFGTNTGEVLDIAYIEQPYLFTNTVHIHIINKHDHEHI